MQYFRPGSQLRQLITMLSIVGEYPVRSLYLLGNERAYKALVHKLTTPETLQSCITVSSKSSFLLPRQWSRPKIIVGVTRTRCFITC